MSSVLDPLLIGLIATLNANVALGALVGARVFDTIAPPETVFPYLVIGDATENAFNAFARKGNRNTLTIHIWHRDTAAGSQEVSSRVVNAVYKAVEAALNLQPVPVTGSTFVLGTLSYVAGILDPDNATYHGVARYEALTRT